MTGANRGVGLEITRQLFDRGDRVIAACRAPRGAVELQGLRVVDETRLHIVELDVLQVPSIEAAAEAARHLTDKVHLLINNAGINGNIAGTHPVQNLSGVFGKIDPDAMAEMFAINVIGPLLVIQVLEALIGGSTVVNITSSMGSKGLMNRGGSYGYRASKAALNIVSRALSFDLRERGTIVIAMHPGWVKTDMGTDDAPYPLTENTSSMLGVIDGLTHDDSGKYFNWRGDELPW